MTLKVKVVDKGPNEVMDIVRELREQGLVQGQDFDFAYHPARYDNFAYDNVDKHAVFTFYTERYATLFTLKYGT